MATYWVPDLPILEAFLATFTVPFWSSLTALDMHDPARIEISNLEFVALFNIFQAKKSSGWGLEKSELPWEWNFS